MTAEQDASGRLLAGRYRLESVLGRGGMGTVWRATDEVLGRPVAVKELRFAAGVDEDERRRLVARTLTEAKAIARVRHTAAVTVYDVVEEDNRPWIVMELVESRSLSEVINIEGVLPPRRAAEIGLELLAVLGQAHRAGILHRDVKPSNILIGHDGRVVLTDFGIARVEGDPSVTSTGMLVGAPSYISPERARGRIPGAPADLWSLGATLYAMVEGRPPYEKGSALSTLTAVMTEDLLPPVNGGALTPVIAGLLRKDPEQRFDEAITRRLLTRVASEADTQSYEQSYEQPYARSYEPSRTPTAVGSSGSDPTQEGTAALALPPEERFVEPLRQPAPVPAPARRSSRRRRSGKLLIGLLVLLLVAGGGVWVALAQAQRHNAGTGSDGASAAAPAGYQRVDGPGGSTVEIPVGWVRTRVSADRSKFQGPAGTLIVDWTDNPGNSALTGVRAEAARTSGSFADYRQLELKTVDYRDGWDAADWEWTYTGSNGTALRATSRYAITDSRDGFSLYWTASAATWDGTRNKELLRTFEDSFQP